MRVVSLALLSIVSGCAPEPSAPGGPPVYSDPVVLFVGPESAALEELRTKDEDAFYTAAGDEMWYARARGVALALSHSRTFALRS